MANHSESDSTSIFDLTGKTDELIVFDLTGILTNVQSEDFVGITIDHNAIGGAIDYLGVDIHYNLT